MNKYINMSILLEAVVAGLYVVVAGLIIFWLLSQRQGLNLPLSGESAWPVALDLFLAGALASYLRNIVRMWRM